jgi:hypothetical protein
MTVHPVALVRSALHPPRLLGKRTPAMLTAKDSL